MLKQSEITTGMIIDRRKFDDYHDLYEKDFSRLFDGYSSSDISKLLVENEAQRQYPLSSLVKADAQKGRGSPNYFRLTTEFYINAMFSVPPEGEGLTPELIDVLENGQRNASKYGHGYFLAQESGVAALDSRFVYEVVSEDGRTKIGYALMHPFKAEAKTEPDRIDISVVIPGQQTIRRTYTFSGMQLGSIVESTPTDALGVFRFGQGYSDYSDIKDSVAEVVIRTLCASHVLDRFTMPYAQIDGFDRSHMTASQLTDRADYARRSQQTGNPMIYSNTEMANTIKVVTWDASLSANSEQINRLLDDIFMSTGVPPTAFGVTRSVFSSMSGTSLERQLFGALQKIRSSRQDLERKFRQAIDLSGITVGDITWVDNPFAEESGITDG